MVALQTEPPPLRISAAGRALIRRFEGLRLDAYRCPAGVWTVGYGHTASAFPGRRIDAAEADSLLEQDLTRVEAELRPLLRVAVTEPQWAALVAFALNIGTGAFARSTLLKKLNAREWDAIPAQLMRWVYAGGRPLAGLRRRREAEAALFAEGSR